MRISPPRSNNATVCVNEFTHAIPFLTTMSTLLTPIGIYFDQLPLVLRPQQRLGVKNTCINYSISKLLLIWHRLRQKAVKIVIVRHQHTTPKSERCCDNDTIKINVRKIIIAVPYLRTISCQVLGCWEAPHYLWAPRSILLRRLLKVVRCPENCTLWCRNERSGA